MKQRGFCVLSHMYWPVIPYAFEELEWLFEAVLAWVFSQHQVVATTCRHKDDSCHVIEALDPFPSLVSLTAHVKHAEQTTIKTFLYLKEVDGTG